MIDLHAHFGRERRAIGYDALMRVLDATRSCRRARRFRLLLHRLR
jgi:hypothetical protein